MIDMSHYRAIWAALETRRPLTLDEIELLTEVSPVGTVRYLDLLARNGYVSMAAVRQADSGESLPLFMLIRRHGPDAPYEDENGKFIDPNIKTRRPEQSEWLSRRTHRDLPTMTGRIRAAALRIGAPCPRSDLESGAGVSGPSARRAFNAALHSLLARGFLRRAPVGLLQYCPHVIETRLRELFLGRLGREVSPQEIKTALDLDRAPGGPAIRSALDILAADGYGVVIKRFGGPWGSRAVYRVDPRPEATNG
jgi:hypothetical protein